MADEPNMKIDYVEFSSPDLDATQAFFAKAFGWRFVEYGPDYRDVQGAGLGGGVERGALQAPLVVLKAEDLESAFEIVKAAGAEITKEIFEFPGGRRFEFIEPGGNAMAIWNEG
ncbi:MAG: VOC family protein [Pseudomonadota bacterium]